MKSLYPPKAWQEDYDAHDSFISWWSNCQRGDHLIWLSAKLKVAVRTLVLAKGHCANTVRHLMEDPRCLAAVDGSIAYGEGRVDIKELIKIAEKAGKVCSIQRYAHIGHAQHAAYASAALYSGDATAERRRDFIDSPGYVDNAVSSCSFAAGACHSFALFANTLSKHYGASEKFIHQAFVANQRLTADICRKYLTSAVMDALDSSDVLKQKQV